MSGGTMGVLCGDTTVVCLDALNIIYPLSAIDSALALLTRCSLASVGAANQNPAQKISAAAIIFFFNISVTSFSRFRLNSRRF